MSTYARLVHSLSDTDSLIPAQAEARGRTATVLQPGWYKLVRSGRYWISRRTKCLQIRIFMGHTGTCRTSLIGFVAPKVADSVRVDRVSLNPPQFDR